MSKEVMVTNMYELTEERGELRQFDTANAYCYDARLDMIMPNKNIRGDTVRDIIFNYTKSFCTLVNMNPNCKPAYLTACGFLPIGIEPTVFTKMVTIPVIIPGLTELGVPFFYQKPMSPCDSRFELTNDSASHDIWVNKLDAAKIVNKPPHMITALDVLEVLM